MGSFGSEESFGDVPSLAMMDLRCNDDGRRRWWSTDKQQEIERLGADSVRIRIDSG
jgi:hypothetical protein